MHKGRREQHPQANQPYGNAEETSIRVVEYFDSHHQNIPETANQSDDRNELPLGILFKHEAVMDEQRDRRISNGV